MPTRIHHLVGLNQSWPSLLPPTNFGGLPLFRVSASSANPDSSTASSAWTIFRRPHFSPYKCYIRRDLKLAVLLNPKVGSSAFRAILVEGLRAANLKPQLGPLWPLSAKRRYTTAGPSDYFHAFNHQSDYDFRCFVRNPYSRVLSAWNDKLVKGFHSPQYPRSMIKFVPKLRRFAAERGIPGATDDAPFPFDSFITYIESQAEGARNQHWDTQRSVLLTDYVNYRHTYQMETDFISGMVDTLSLAGLDPEWVGTKLARPTNASGAIANPVYTPAIAARVHRLYACDFAQFGYDKDSWQGL